MALFRARPFKQAQTELATEDRTNLRGTEIRAMISLAPKTPSKVTGGNRPRDWRLSVVCAPVPGVQRIEHLARGKKLAPSCEAFSAPGARAVRGLWPEKPITGTRNDLSRQARGGSCERIPDSRGGGAPPPARRHSSSPVYGW